MKRTKSKILSILLSLVMVIGILPTFASADPVPAVIALGNIEIAPDADELSDTIPAPGSGSYTWDAATYTLTLTDVHLNGDEAFLRINGASDPNQKITVKLAGTNELKCTANTSPFVSNAPIVIEGAEGASLRVQSDKMTAAQVRADLEMKSGTAQFISQDGRGMDSKKSVTVSGGTLKLASSEDMALVCFGGGANSAVLTVNGGALEAKFASEDEELSYSAIQCDKLTVNGGTLRAESERGSAVKVTLQSTIADSNIYLKCGVDKMGIEARKGNTVSGSWYETAGKEAFNGKNPGAADKISDSVLWNNGGTTGIVVGSATLPDNACVRPDSTLTIPTGASLIVPEGITFTNHGIIKKEGTLTVNGTLECDSHIGGQATTEKKAICDICGQEYGKLKVPDTSTEISKDAVNLAVQNAKNNEIILKAAAGKTGASIPVSSLSNIVTLGDSVRLTVVMQDGTATLDKGTLKTIFLLDSGMADFNLNITKRSGVDSLAAKQKDALKKYDVADVLTASITTDGQTVSDFKGGKVTISFPFTLPEGVSADDYFILYVADDGEIEKIPTAYADGRFTFTVSHFSDYVLARDTAAPAAPATGDGAVAIWVMLGMLSVFGAAVLIVRKRFDVR